MDESSVQADSERLVLSIYHEPFLPALLIIVAPYLMYQRYYNVIERVNILGGELASVYTGGVPRALAVDYRYRKINPRLFPLYTIL